MESLTIKPFMSFGKMPLANGFLNKNEFQKEFFYEMEVGFSEDISLFQLNQHPKPEKMFNEKYPFYTGSSNFMKKHFKKWFSKILVMTKMFFFQARANAYQNRSFE